MYTQVESQIIKEYGDRNIEIIMVLVPPLHTQPVRWKIAGGKRALL